MGKLYIEVKKMSNEKLKEIRLTKKAKYGFGTMFLVAAFGIGFASLATQASKDDYVAPVVNVDPVIDDGNKEEPVVVVEDEKLVKPFSVNATIKTYYFDLNDTSKNQENALVYYNGMYTPSNGVDYFYNNVAFDVMASFSGTVIERKVDPLYGASVYIKSNDNDLVAIYSSLSDVKVNVGDKVNQGDIIAKAGNNTINSNLGNHLNFSLLKNNKYINPLTYYSKVIKEI